MTIKADMLDARNPLRSRRPPLCYLRPHVGPVPNHNGARVALTLQPDQHIGSGASVSWTAANRHQ
jgi:hypothetical protein